MNEQIQAEIKKIFNGRFSTSESTRANYARGEDTYDPILSQAVVFPETNEEVSKILKLCNENKIPVVPFGTGTSLEGNVVGNDKGITISLEKMNKILSVNVEDFDCRVQACVTREQLNDYLREDGVFFSNRSRSKCSAGRYGSDFCIWDYGCQVWHYENSDKWTYSCPCKW
jgi:D-lactate dehydrogenase (cytochrome)